MPRRIPLLALASLALAAGPSYADTPAPRRVALVVGNESYAAGALPTAGRDAELVARALRQDGFDVVVAHDLDADALRKSFADLARRAARAGPEGVAFAYVAGYAVRHADEGYVLPIGTSTGGPGNAPLGAVPLHELTGPLEALPLAARVEVLDASYRLPPGLARSGEALAARVPPAATLLAHNAGPGEVAPPGKGVNGTYAKALAEALGTPGATLEEAFDLVRLHVNEATDGAVIPWSAAKRTDDVRLREGPPRKAPPDGAAAPAASLPDAAAPAASRREAEAPPVREGRPGYVGTVGTVAKAPDTPPPAAQGRDVKPPSGRDVPRRAREAAARTDDPGRRTPRVAARSGETRKPRVPDRARGPSPRDAGREDAQVGLPPSLRRTAPMRGLRYLQGPDATVVVDPERRAVVAVIPRRAPRRMPRMGPFDGPGGTALVDPETGRILGVVPARRDPYWRGAPE